MYIHLVVFFFYTCASTIFFSISKMQPWTKHPGMLVGSVRPGAMKPPSIDGRIMLLQNPNICGTTSMIHNRNKESQRPKAKSWVSVS